MTWHVRVTAAADADFEDILRWTMHRFGAEQTAMYAETIRSALKALGAGPQTPGAMIRKEFGENLYTLHVARIGRRGRHFILFRAESAERTVQVLRILHDAMDASRHVPKTDRG